MVQTKQTKTLTLARYDLSEKGWAYYQNIFSKLDWFSRKNGWPELE